MPLPQHDFSIHKHFFHSLILECVREYFLAIHTLAPFFLALTSILATLHHKLDGHFSLFLEDYELNQDLELSSNSSKLTFQHMS
jgi:hypothetical protein